MKNKVRSLPSIDHQNQFVRNAYLGNMPKLASKRNQVIIKKPLKLFHATYAIHPNSFGKNKYLYFPLMISAGLKYILLKEKYEVFATFKIFKTFIERKVFII